MNTFDNTIRLLSPVVRKDQRIEQVCLKIVVGADLHGVRLIDLVNSNVDALAETLPRITRPQLTTDEIYGLCAADLVQLANVLCAQLMAYQSMEEGAINSGVLQ